MMRTVLRAGLAAWILIAAAASVFAAPVRVTIQAPTPRDPAALALISPAVPTGDLSQHPVAPLTPDQILRLGTARGTRDVGQPARARDSLIALLAEVPHHALILTELARTYVVQGDFVAIERLGRTERAAQRDSLLLAHEYALALERLGRPRDAAQVAIEVWCVSETQSPWAFATVIRLAAADPHGIPDALRKAAERYPSRPELMRGLGMVESQVGDFAAAIRAFENADHAGLKGGARWGYAEDLMRRGNPRDSLTTIDVLMGLAGDKAADPSYRLQAARRVWELDRARNGEREGAINVLHALGDLPPARWQPDLVADLARALRRAGMTAESRTLLDARGAQGALSPELALEQALADLKDGPPEAALPALQTLSEKSPEGAFRFAEALFYAGQADSALHCYQRIAADPQGTFTGAALERVYLIEGASPREALTAFGRIAYADWRGDTRASTALAESLYHTLPIGALWAQAALIVSARYDAAGDPQAALAPLLAVADTLPEDRLAPVARQRAGDLYLLKLKDERRALDEYEECLARYPRAWNAPEVRRKAEALRRERRF